MLLLCGRPPRADTRTHRAGGWQGSANPGGAQAWVAARGAQAWVAARGAGRARLQLGHGLGRLLHGGHVDAPVAKVRLELRVEHEVVLVGGVAVDVRAVRRDGAQLDHERVFVARVVEVLQRRACTQKHMTLVPRKVQAVLRCAKGRGARRCRRSRPTGAGQSRWCRPRG